MEFRFNFCLEDKTERKIKNKSAGFPEAKKESQRTFTLRQFLQDCVDEKNKLEFSEIKLNNNEKILYISSSLCISDNGSCDVDDVLKQSDVVKGVYEGGLKLWEGSIDLTNYISTNVNMEDKIVMELGCGIGLPGILAAKRSPKMLLFQDFNEFVLANCTAPSLYHNLLSSNNNDSFIGKDFFDNVHFIAGNWCDINIEQKVDVILTSETIYEPQSFSLLHDIIDRSLSHDGVAYIASKVFYFGVGGGTTEWRNFVAQKGIFQINLVEKIDAPLRREIWKMVRK